MAEKSDKHDKLAQKPASLEEFIKAAGKNIQARLPKNIDPEKFILGLMTAIQKSRATAPAGKSLADCDPKSVLLAAYEAAEQGCSLSPSLALGWLIPYAKEAQFQPSYRFFVQRAYWTGEVKSFFAEVVYEGDEFARQYAPQRRLSHAPGPNTGNRDKAIGAYALIEFTDGSLDFEYLTAEQIDKHRNCSKAPNSLMWTSFWQEAFRKTPIRVLAKRLPLKSPKLEEFVETVNRDAERDIVIPLESYQEPTPPRRIEEEQPKQETKQEQTKEPAKESPKEEPAEKKNGHGSMFTQEGEEEYLSPGDIREFWDTALGSGWKKEAVVTMLKKDFGVSALKDLPKAKMQSALDVIRSARE